MRILLSLFFIFFGLNAHADIKWTEVLGFSKTQQWNMNNNQSVVVLGGFGGPDCTGPNLNSTCNNCTDSFNQICNKTRAYPTMLLQVRFSSTEKIGVPRISTVNAAGAPVPPLAGQIISIPTTTAVNQAVTVSVPWSSLCANINEDNITTCQIPGASKAFKLGIDGNSDGDLEDPEDDKITFTVVVHRPTDATFLNASADPAGSNRKGLYNFSLFPGDEKAYIQNISLDSAAERPITTVHFMCQEDGYTSIRATDVCASVTVANNTLDKDFITGLTNGQTFYFYAASEDDTGNIGLYLTEEDDNCPTTPINGHCRAVTPSAVGGLFKDNCFIATAAYGSKMEPQVQLLRQFRDQYLMTNTAGKSFVRFYYKVSPSIANWISASEDRRAITRWALAPVVISVRAFMWAPVLCMIGFTLFAFVVLSPLYRRQLQPLIRKGRN